MLKKLLLSLLAAGSLSNQVIAFESQITGPALKIKGGAESQSAFLHNNGTPAQKLMSANKKYIGLNSAFHVKVELEDIIENFAEYGAKVSLETTARNDRRVAAHLFFISDYGKLELGSDKSATAKMKITAYSIGVATGGGWDLWINPRNAKKIAFITNFGNFLDAKTRDGTKAEYSRKISYFTPEIAGLRLGISYIPDSSNTGYGSINELILHKPVKPETHKFAITDGIGYGIEYEAKLDEEFKIKAALVGEKGKVQAFTLENNVRTNEKFKNLSTYTIGAEVKYHQYAIAVSYVDYLRSLTSSTIDKNKDTYAWGIGGRYKPGDLSASLNYFSSNHKKNKMHAITLATEYKLVPGLVIYAEDTIYRTNGKHQDDLGKITLDKTRGNLLILGGKLEF